MIIYKKMYISIISFLVILFSGYNIHAIETKKAPVIQSLLVLQASDRVLVEGQDAIAKRPVVGDVLTFPLKVHVRYGERFLASQSDGVVLDILGPSMVDFRVVPREIAAAKSRLRVLFGHVNIKNSSAAPMQFETIHVEATLEVGAGVNINSTLANTTVKAISDGVRLAPRMFSENSIALKPYQVVQRSSGDLSPLLQQEEKIAETNAHASEALNHDVVLSNADIERPSKAPIQQAPPVSVLSLLEARVRGVDFDDVMEMATKPHPKTMVAKKPDAPQSAPVDQSVSALANSLSKAFSKGRSPASSSGASTNTSSGPALEIKHVEPLKKIKDDGSLGPLERFELSRE